MRCLIKRVKKRDGRIVEFEQEKITNAIFKAASSVGKKDRKLAERMSDDVVKILNQRFAGKIPDVETIQDIVEEVLIANKQDDIAKSYILYRRSRTQLREIKKQLFGIYDDMKLPLNSMQVLAKRYLQRNDEGAIIETPGQMFRRVAHVIAAVDSKYGDDAKYAEEEFYNVMTNFEFIPNSPTLMNAGTRLGQLSACFVLPVGDSLVEIFDTIKYTALIHQSGGGTGFSFSRLRPKGDLVGSTKSIASGPVSFMNVFDVTTEVIKQGGRRRGANMGILRCDHPDILEFISAKTDGKLKNFNISVSVTDSFMEAVEKNKSYDLINPRTKEKTKTLNAKEVFDIIVANAWKGGDPGLIFIDEINRHNPTPHLGAIESTNPCGEVPLLPYESCNLGSINLAKMVKDGKMNWEKLAQTVRTAVHFLDNVIDANKYPLQQIEEITKANRKIGLGVMGFADALFMMDIKYDSPQAIKFAEKLMKFIEDEAIKSSSNLAKQRGNFPNFEKSTWKRKVKTLRNATLTTIAPTGSISIIAGCSSGIEPIFAVSFIRNVLEGTKLLEINPIFEQIARERKFYSRELMMKIATKGSIKDIKEIPRDVREIFVTALDIDPEWHVRMQAAFQKYVDNAVSKTVNLPHSATPKDVEKIYLMAYKLKCKGITVYRYGSKPEQVLYIGMIPGRPEEVGEEQRVIVESEYSGGCPGGTLCNI